MEVRECLIKSAGGSRRGHLNKGTNLKTAVTELITLLRYDKETGDPQS